MIAAEAPAHIKQEPAVEPAPGKTLLPAPGAFLFALIALVVATVRAIPLLNSDGDLARHIRVGDHILRTRALPDSDVFSHTMFGQPFVPYEWLSEILFAAAHASAGLPGVAIFSALIIATVATLVYFFCERHGVDALLGFAAALAAILVSSVHWLARPHLFTILASILLLFLLHRNDKRALGWTFVVFAFWTNLHGGFVYGLVLIALYILGDLLEIRFSAEPAEWRSRARQHAAMLAIAAAATVVNPVGVKLHAHVLGYLGNSYLVDHTFEYMSPNFHELPLQLFLGVVVLVFALLALSRRRMALTTLLVVAVNTGFAFYAARNIPLFAMTAMPLLALHFDADWRALQLPFLNRIKAAFHLGATRGSTLPWVIVTVIGLGMLGMNGGRLAGTQVVPQSFQADRFPVAAVQRARAAALEGRIFNYFTWGGYLLYAWPEQRVFIDGQTDFYGADLTRTYQKIIGLKPGWRSELDKWQIGTIIVPAASSLAAEVLTDRQWSEWHRDETAVVIVRAAR